MFKISFISSVCLAGIFFLTAGFPLKAQYDFGQFGYSTENGGTTGGAGGQTVRVSSFADLKRYAEEKDTKYIIEVEGTINGAGSIADTSYQGSIKVGSNKTVLGVGKSAFLSGVGLLVFNSNNVIIRNLKITLSTIKIPESMADTDIKGIYSAKGDEGRAQILVNEGDCLSIKGKSFNVWVDHCEIYNENPETQLNIDLYDGLLDIKNEASFITVSWCYFHDHHKCHLVGKSDKDDVDRKTTFHHNFYSNIDERLPSYRFGKAHIFNNYYVNLKVSGINCRMGACIKAEKNYFENAAEPVFYSNKSITSGFWDVDDNKYVNCSGNQPVTSTCTLVIPYKYTKSLIKDPAKVKSIVSKYAGVGKIYKKQPDLK